MCDPGLGDAVFLGRLVLLDVDFFLAVFALVWGFRKDVTNKITKRRRSGIVMVAMSTREEVSREWMFCCRFNVVLADWL